ncbi:MAG: LytTR family DNA-binding domain-containing protein [Lachnospiraceae bacterium]|nr:LytTR family DNA-binding domain-containing protein [Lachnospiraceae bacterium]
MYHIVICDDEKEIMDDIFKKVRSCFDGNNISARYTGIDDSRKLMECIQNEKIDVLFLDIDMPYHSGMDIAGYINEQGLQIILIFITSQDALVYQTFAYRPFGFIRKTYIDQEINELVKRIHNELLENKKELVIRKGQELIRVLIKDIIYIEAEKNYLLLKTCDEMIRIRETMTNVSNELQGKGFIRCHKGYLVHAEYIEKLRNSEIVLRAGNESITLPVGRSYEKEVRKKIFEMLRN